jgi:regulatory protein YycI of two-component signal transduction system YycFG
MFNELFSKLYDLPDIGKLFFIILFLVVLYFLGRLFVNSNFGIAEIIRKKLSAENKSQKEDVKDE